MLKRVAFLGQAASLNVNSEQGYTFSRGTSFVQMEDSDEDLIGDLGAKQEQQQQDSEENQVKKVPKFPKQQQKLIQQKDSKLEELPEELQELEKLEKELEKLEQEENQQQEMQLKPENDLKFNNEPLNENYFDEEFAESKPEANSEFKVKFKDQLDAENAERLAERLKAEQAEQQIQELQKQIQEDSEKKNKQIQELQKQIQIQEDSEKKNKKKKASEKINLMKHKKKILIAVVGFLALWVSFGKSSIDTKIVVVGVACVGLWFYKTYVEKMQKKFMKWLAKMQKKIKDKFEQVFGSEDESDSSRSEQSSDNDLDSYESE